MYNFLAAIDPIVATIILFDFGFTRFAVNGWDGCADDDEYFETVVWARDIADVEAWGARFFHCNPPTPLPMAHYADGDRIAYRN